MGRWSSWIGRIRISDDEDLLERRGSERILQTPLSRGGKAQRREVYNYISPKIYETRRSKLKPQMNPSNLAWLNTFATFSQTSLPFLVEYGLRARMGTIYLLLSRNLIVSLSDRYTREWGLDIPFMAEGDESNHGLEPRLSGKKPFVPPTATLRIR